MGPLRVGLADHLGWAIAVTVSADLEVVDRRRLELVAPDVAWAPIHHEGKGLDDEAVAALIAEVRASVAETAAASLDALASDLPGPIASVSLRVWPPDFPTELSVLRRSPWEARADAVMYREIVAEVGRARGWDVHTYEAKVIGARAAEILGSRAGEVLDGQRARLGPPWTKDHRTALAATVVAGAGS